MVSSQLFAALPELLTAHRYADILVDVLIPPIVSELTEMAALYNAITTFNTTLGR